MHRLVSRLVLYSDLAQDDLIAEMTALYRDWQKDANPNKDTRSDLRFRVNALVKRLLDVGRTYGFNGDLWCDYIAFLLLTSENPFSLSLECRDIDAQDTLSDIARADMAYILKLVRWDFSDLEDSIDSHALRMARHFEAMPRAREEYFADISAQVHTLSDGLAHSKTAEEAFDLVSHIYSQTGVGLFGLNGAFRVRGERELSASHVLMPAQYTANSLQFVPINNARTQGLHDLVGYELQKEQLLANTEAFVSGLPANNVLLYGDAGTGKSTCVKALVGQYFDRGLRMIEIYKYQFRDLSRVVEVLKHRAYRFIIFIDDLSFEEDEVEYKFLKAVIEGGVESRPENVLIYATSNRRHLVRETWNDRSDMQHDGDIHRSDTMEEKLSLAERFGVAINFSSPTPKQYHHIVLELAARELPDRTIEDDDLLKIADRWEIRHGGVSGRVARQLIDYLAGTFRSEES